MVVNKYREITKSDDIANGDSIELKRGGETYPSVQVLYRFLRV